ncbi:PAS domain S-box protein [Belnapia sp. T18]|uniref:histidine kinase n=1 Tax=Belnapia arida TaxID=2804533 RepID=A0ABS1UAV1_9PROT|nr:PAS domain S-box protein [Belnapia arida]MBL6081250.1 PAS domain S-box protein [Belnapia arida]
MNSRKVDLARHRLPSPGRLAELVLESTADFAVLTICLDGIITSWNSAAERVMGWSEANAVSQHASMIFTPEDQVADVCAGEMVQAQRCGRAADERWHMRKDGTRFWGSGSMTRLEDDETGEHIGYAKIVRDRTDQHLAGEKLRGSEAVLRNVLESSADCLKLLAPDGCVTFMNAAGLAMLEVSSFAEIAGKDYVTLWPAEQQDGVRAALAEAAAGGVGRLHGYAPTLKGAARWWDLQVTSVPGVNGQPDFLLASSRDVTERERSREVLRESEERFRALAAASTAIVWTTDPQGLAKEDSPDWRDFTGQTPEQWLSTSWQDAIHPDDRVRIVEAWTRAVASGTPLDAEYRLRRADGEWRLTAAKAVPVRSANGAIREWVGANVDITDQRRVEEARWSIEERYRLAVRATNDAIWDWDLRRDYVEWNEALRAAHGYTLEEVDPSGTWWMEHIHADDRERVRNSIHAAIDGTGTHWSNEYRFQRADGTYADVFDRGFMVRGPGGEPLRMIGAMLDVTDRRHSERTLQRLNEELEVEVPRRTEQLRQQEEVLRQSQKLEAVGQLTGGVAHDFNNLLTVIRSSASLLRRPDLSEERRRRYVDAISDTADRATKLTRQLLAFARRQPLSPEVFIVGERVQGVVELIRPLVGMRVVITASNECADCAVEADLNQFETALVNLAVNARDAMDGEGRLAMQTWLATSVPATRGHAGTPGAFIAVSLSDTGAGILPETLGRIFEPFFTTKEVGKGTGLGLSQVYGFAKQSGGELHVESKPGEGSTFTLYLPRADTKLMLTIPRPDAEAEASVMNRRNVLLVEDNTQVGEFARQVLEDPGFLATWAPNAKVALALMDEDASRFDVVFSDVVMPGMNGVDLGKEIRRRWPGLPVILTSGYGHVLTEDGAKGFALLHKPYSPEDLSKALRHLG